MEYLSVFVENINDYLAQTGLTVNKFSNKIGVAERAVAGWLNFRSFPSVDCVVKVAKELNCSSDYLFGLTDVKEKRVNYAQSSFIDKFLSLLQDKGVTQYRVARDCGFGESMISKWKRGKKPKTETLIKLAEYFGCPLDFFIG
ncbi:MAG: helix-turn-helix transcriptional regulator [Christensenellales bacterium]